MTLNWNALPASTAVDFYRSQLNKMLNPQTYGFGQDQWNLTDILKQTPEKKIPALQLISGDAPNGNPRPDRAFMVNGMPMIFRLKVLTRQACYKDKQGKIICTNDEQYRFDRDKKVMVESHDEKPVSGDIVRWKNRMRDPDTVIMAEGLMNSEITPLMAEPHLSASHLNAWTMNGEEVEIYEEFIVDSDLCISVPIKYAQPMLKKNGFRSGPEFRKVDRPKQGEKPSRRIANWWFKEVPSDYHIKKENQGRLK